MYIMGIQDTSMATTNSKTVKDCFLEESREELLKVIVRESKGSIKLDKEQKKVILSHIVEPVVKTEH